MTKQVYGQLNCDEVNGRNELAPTRSTGRSYLTRVLAALLVTRADHAVGDVEFAVLQPRVAQLAVLHRHLHLVHLRLVLRLCNTSMSDSKLDWVPKAVLPVSSFLPQPITVHTVPGWISSLAGGRHTGNKCSWKVTREES